MRPFLRWASGYVLDFFRERVTAHDFRTDPVGRVLLASPSGDASSAAAHAVFPGAELRAVAPRTGLWQVRRMRFGAAWIPMAGGDARGRALGLLSGARHKLLVPSPDHIYRLGLRAGWPSLAWAVIDRFLVAPLALVWLSLQWAWLCYTGLLRQASGSNPDGPEPGKVLIIQLVPTPLLLALLAGLRSHWPAARLYVVQGAPQAESAVLDSADRVIAAGMGPAELLTRVRRLAPDLALLAGGADYGIGPPYLKGALLARLSRARQRWQWELGDELPGRPLGEGAIQAASQAARRLWRRSGQPPWDWLARPWLRLSYHRPPRRGPKLVQIGITEACNYRCLMCPFHNPAVDDEHRESDLPRMSYQAFARLLSHLKRMGTQEIDLCGNGEPLTHPDALAMVELARDMGFGVALATNVSLLTEERARRLVNAGLSRVHASINAGTEETYARLHPGARPGAFAAIVDRLRGMADYAETAARRPVEIEFSAVLTRPNMGELAAMVEAAHRARATGLMLTLMGPVRGQPDLAPRPEDWPGLRREIARARERAGRLGIRSNLDDLLATASDTGKVSIYRSIPCYIGHEFALILGGGKVVFCCHCSRSMGDIGEEGFAQIWTSETYREARRKAMDLPRTREPVWECGCFEACPHVSLNLLVHRRLYGQRALRSVL